MKKIKALCFAFVACLVGSVVAMLPNPQEQVLDQDLQSFIRYSQNGYECGVRDESCEFVWQEPALPSHDVDEVYQAFLDCDYQGQCNFLLDLKTHLLEIGDQLRERNCSEAKCKVLQWSLSAIDRLMCECSSKAGQVVSFSPLSQVVLYFLAIM